MRRSDQVDEVQKKRAAFERLKAIREKKKRLRLAAVDLKACVVLLDRMSEIPGNAEQQNSIGWEEVMTGSRPLRPPSVELVWMDALPFSSPTTDSTLELPDARPKPIQTATEAERENDNIFTKLGLQEKRDTLCYPGPSPQQQLGNPRLNITAILTQLVPSRPPHVNITEKPAKAVETCDDFSELPSTSKVPQTKDIVEVGPKSLSGSIGFERMEELYLLEAKLGRIFASARTTQTAAPSKVTLEAGKRPVEREKKRKWDESQSRAEPRAKTPRADPEMLRRRKLKLLQRAKQKFLLATPPEAASAPTSKFLSPLSQLLDQRPVSPVVSRPWTSHQRPFARVSAENVTVPVDLVKASEPSAAKSPPKKRVRFSDEVQVRVISPLCKGPPRPDLIDEILSGDSAGSTSTPANSVAFQSLPSVVDQFEKILLRWNPVWLEEYSLNDGLPDLFGVPDVLHRLKQTKFRSFDDYVIAFKFFFLCEIWEQTAQEYLEKKAKGEIFPEFSFWLEGQQLTPSFKTFHLIGLFPREKESKLNLLSKSLLVVRLKVDGRELPFLGLVKSWSQRWLGTQSQCPDLLRALWSDTQEQFLVQCTVRIRMKTNTPPVYRGLVKLKGVGSIVSATRVIEGLASLKNSALCNAVLHPSIATVGYLSSDLPPLRTLLAYNFSQSSVIRSLTYDIFSQPRVPRIKLVHGPPGSGKSRTILGLVEEIKRTKMDCNRQGVVILTAASNGAVDELARNIIRRNEELYREHGTRFFNFLRVGRTDQMSPDVRKHSLEHLVRKNVDSIMQRTGLRADSRNLELCRKRAGLESRHLREERKKLLLFSDVIATTLNSSGCLSLNELTNVPVFCVIVDEACQATELETLIPLRFSTYKLVLVGDPCQLPPTVLSREASSAHYSNSLFSRCVAGLREDGMEHSGVMFLNEQYRMHPEIASFPARHFYGGLLTTPRSLEWGYPLPPYMVFNLSYGQEERGGTGSYKNQAEKQFVASLCSNVTREANISPKDIGVISFYKAQVSELSSRLGTPELRDVEVATVDGFQGREKSVIVVSCVRGGKSKLGFLEDQRRLTVAITRAKAGLYIVANAATLQKNADWKALFTDAADRGLLCNLQTPADVAPALRRLRPLYPTSFHC